MLKNYNIVIFNRRDDILYETNEIKAYNKQEACGKVLIKYIEFMKQNRPTDEGELFNFFHYNLLPDRFKLTEILPQQYEIISLTALQKNI